MTDLRQAAQQALEALKSAAIFVDSFRGQKATQDAITALKAALEQQAEPVADEDYNALSQRHLASIKHDMRVTLEDAAARAMHQVSEFAQAQVQAEPVPIYYMRDNHTFKELSADVSTALVEIESEFNAGYTYGSLCSKREGFPKVHASGYEHRLVFFWECKTVLEKWIYTPPQQQAEPVAWTGYDLEGMVEAFSRVIEAHHSSKHPFHNPVDMDAKMALRILRGFIPAMKAYATAPQRKPLTDEQILDLIKNCPKEDHEVAGWIVRQRLIWCRAIEAAHGIKEGT